MRVLAKRGHSGNPNAEVDLWTHTEDVLESSEALFGVDGPTRLCHQWFRFFKLSLEDWSDFRRRLTLACLWHDLGKASCSFQGMLQEDLAQVIRHEYISALLWFQTLAKVAPDDTNFVPFAVLGHHLKSGRRYLANLGMPSSLIVKIYRDDRSAIKILRHVERVLKLDEGSLQLCPDFSDRILLDEKTWGCILDRLESRFRKSENDARQLRALTLALVVSDAAGSALRRTSRPLSAWLREQFPEIGLSPDDVESTVLKGRIEQIERDSGGVFEMNRLQQEAMGLPSRAALLAPCGAGKTLAAWLWAKEQLRTHNATRVIFLYPTRNTATEGFRDYVSWGLEQASLIHGTAAYDLEGIHFQGTESRAHHAGYQPDEALFSLGYWGKAYISATVDSFLTITDNRYAATCLAPLLCDSLVIVDEVHAFDPTMFTHLLALLKEFDFPALLMTATLPKRYRESLKELDLPIREVEEATLQATRPRYELSFSSEPMSDAVREWLDTEQSRLLVVCNTVSSCQTIAREIKGMIDGRDDLRLLVYHSRFRLCDRRERHEEVIRTFKTEGERVIVVSTQVCQMSLDLDAQTLLSELAPLPDVVQRMGRVNRRALQSRGRVVLFPPSKARPYTDQDLSKSKELLCRLSDPSAVSQAQLAELVADLEGARPLTLKLVPLVSELPRFEQSREYRQTDEFTRQCLLDEDIERYQELREKRDPEFVGLELPVPRYEAKELSGTRIPAYLGKALSVNYCPTFGYGEIPQ